MRQSNGLFSRSQLALCFKNFTIFITDEHHNLQRLGFRIRRILPMHLWPGWIVSDSGVVMSSNNHSPDEQINYLLAIAMGILVFFSEFIAGLFTMPK
jgi:hypothetical protein